MDVAKRVRKSYELFAIKEKRRDCSEGINEKVQQARATLELRTKKKNFRKDQPNNRFLSVGLNAPQSNSNFPPNNKTQNSRDGSRNEKSNRNGEDQVIDQLNERFGYERGTFDRQDEPARVSSCAPGDMKQSMNSVVSTAFGETTTSGKGGTFKKSEASSFT